jgi:hypothetical protein
MSEPIRNKRSAIEPIQNEETQENSLKVAFISESRNVENVENNTVVKKGERIIIFKLQQSPSKSTTRLGDFELNESNIEEENSNDNFEMASENEELSGSKSLIDSILVFSKKKIKSFNIYYSFLEYIQ